MPLHKVSVTPMDTITASVPLQEIHSAVEKCDDRTSHTTSLSSNGFDICRICHCEGDVDVPLIAPCYCAGSLRYVHQGCLQQWIKSSNIRCCELCKFQFIMQTKTKPFIEWEHLEMSGLERRKLLCAVLFHAVALTCVIWSLYVLIARTYDEIQIGSLEWPFWTKLFVVAIGITGGVVFMYIQCKAYLHICQRWKAYNRVIYVQNAPEKPHIPSPKLPVKPSSTSESHTVHMGPEQSTHNCSAAASSNVEAPYRGDDERSIDMKGVRNLHIFLDEENRICVHKDEKQSRLVEYLESGEPNVSDCNAATVHRPEYENVNSGSVGTSWRIQIEKTNGKDIGKVTESRALEEIKSSENSDSRQYVDDYQVTCNDGNESPVLKLQIKKAEIVIKFGGGANEPTANTIDNVELENERTGQAVSVTKRDESDKEECESLEISPNSDTQVKLSDSQQQQQDDEGSEDSLSNCGSPTCRLLPESEPTEYSNLARPKSYPFDKRQSLNSGTWTPKVENSTTLDQDVSSQSPLLVQKNDSATNNSKLNCDLN